MMQAAILFLNLGAGEVFIIILIIVMFFGTKNLPQLARGLGKGIRDFREAAGNIQREIQEGAEEMKKTINIQEELDELKAATDVMKNDIQEGLNNINNDANAAMADDALPADQQQQLPEPDNNDIIPGSIKRG
jgi:sec-independent protein translocase protein TatA